MALQAARNVAPAHGLIADSSGEDRCSLWARRQQFGHGDELVSAGAQAGDDRRERIGGARGVGLGDVKHYNPTIVRVAQHFVGNGGRVVVEGIVADDVVLDHGAMGRGDRPQRAGVVAAARESEVPSLPAAEAREDRKTSARRLRPSARWEVLPGGNTEG
jgi:hypothetical protein